MHTVAMPTQTRLQFVEIAAMTIVAHTTDIRNQYGRTVGKNPAVCRSLMSLSTRSIAALGAALCNRLTTSVVLLFAFVNALTAIQIAPPSAMTVTPITARPVFADSLRAPAG